MPHATPGVNDRTVQSLKKMSKRSILVLKQRHPL
jgi:hypothetical protein